MDLSEINFAVLVASLIVASTPLVLAAVGELIVEKSGVLNLGVEGMMIIGAVAGFIIGVETGSAYIGMMAAAVAGALLSLLFAFIILIMQANQVASGLALTIFGLGIAALMGHPYTGIKSPQISTISIPILSEIPILGTMFFQHDLIVYLSLISVLVIWYFLNRLRAGLILRSVGEDHDVAHSLGYRVVTMPPAASGGLVLLQTLNILENFDLKELGHNSAKTVHLLSESMQRAYADRAAYHGDPDYYEVPIKQMLNRQYSRDLADQISETRTPNGQIFAGDLSKYDESPDTTHFSIIDSKGNAVSNTYTLGSSFGSGVTIEKGGFLMNNQMRNFSHFYGREDVKFGTSEANKLEPGKRMISTQTPTLVFKPDGQLLMILGSPGGGRIPNIITQVISNVIDHDMSFSEAVMAPRINQRLEGKLQLETGFSPDTIQLLKQRGHEPEISTTMGSVQAIFLGNETIYGVADTRRPGALAKGY